MDDKKWNDVTKNAPKSGSFTVHSSHRDVAYLQKQLNHNADNYILHDHSLTRVNHTH